jgi:RHS repeat-associated protein
VTDRLGSVRANTQGDRFAYYPYGEEQTVTVDSREKFGTYFRDGVGQDYAMARYYGSGTGRFWSPDPSGVKAARPGKPTSWNRYAYVLGDPVNRFDPSGREDVADDGDWGGWDDSGGGGGDGGGGDVSVGGADVSVGDVGDGDDTDRDDSDCVPFLPCSGEATEDGGIGNPPGSEGTTPFPTNANQTLLQVGAIPWPELGETAEEWWTALGDLVGSLGIIQGLGRILHGPTSRDLAPVKMIPYASPKNANGGCEPVDPKLKVKWRGSDPSHWHWIQWYQNPTNCMNYPHFRTGPDPGPEYTEIPR